jgi:hypothetical protein
MFGATAIGVPPILDRPMLPMALYLGDEQFKSVAHNLTASK